MRKRKNFVNKVLWQGKKPYRRIGKRITALFFALALLFSSVSVGVLVPDWEVKAIAGVDDMTMLVEYLKIVSVLAGASAGTSNADMLTTAGEAGITSWSDAKGYVHDSMSGNSTFSSFMESLNINTQKIQEMEICVASAFFMGGYVVKKEFMNKIFDTNSDVLVGNPDRADWDYDPVRDGWDKDKYDNLTEEQKERIFFEDQASKVYEEMSKLSNAVPDPDYDFNDDDDDNSVREKLKDKFNDKGEPIDPEGNPYVLDDAVISGAFGTAVYKLLYNMAKRTNQTEARSHLTYADPEEETDVFQYRLDDWEKERRVMYMESAKLLPSSPTVQGIALEFYFSSSPGDDVKYSPYSGSKYYPCFFYKDDKPYLGLASDTAGYPFSYTFRYGYVQNDVYGGGNFFSFPDSVKKTSLNDLKWKKLWSDFNTAEFDYLLKNRQKVDGYVKVCDAPYLIDCGTEENFETFSSLIQSGDYTLEELLECMQDGWKSLPKKSWQSVDDEGETAKKVINSDKGKKYKKTGTKKSKKDDGSTSSEKNQEGANFSSVVAGMQQGEDSLTSPKTSIDELLGGQTTLPGSYPISNPSTGIGGSSGSGTGNPDPPSPTPTPLPEPGAVPSVPGTDDLQWYERFPFCIPWDIYDGVSALKAETKVPKWRIPFEIKRLGIKEGVTIDLSEYEGLRTICNWFLRVLFALGLVMISRPIIKG